MRKILFLVFCLNLAYGREITGFQSDIYSKSGGLKKIQMSLKIISPDEIYDKAPLYDALNVIVGSFYAEDLMTSLGKENFKKNFAKYAQQEHSIVIDMVYIVELKFIGDADIDKIIKAIKERDLCGR